MNSQSPRSPAEMADRYDGTIGCVFLYLSALERRDLDAARHFVSDDLELTFPGSVKRSSVDEIVAGSAKRYRHIGKHIDGCDLCQTPDGTSVVFVRGTLYGQWPNGGDFAGIRFIDRFELRDGLIRRQDVWNDAGESRSRA